MPHMEFVMGDVPLAVGRAVLVHLWAPRNGNHQAYFLVGAIMGGVQTPMPLRVVPSGMVVPTLEVHGIAYERCSMFPSGAYF